MTNVVLLLVALLVVVSVTPRLCRRISEWADRRVELMVAEAFYDGSQP